MGLKKFLTYSLIAMLLFIAAVTSILNKSLGPLKQAKAETVSIAQKEASLAEVDDFFWYNGDETYFTVTGKDKDSKKIIFLLKQAGGSFEVIEQEGSLSKSEAIKKVRELENPEHILEARIGKHKGLAVWEVSFRQENGKIAYTMLSLETGEWLRTIKNI